MLENTKTTHWHCKTLLQLSSIILSVLFECPIFWSDFFCSIFCSNFFVQSIWMPIFFSDIFVWSICPIFLSYFFWSLFRPTFCPLNVRFFVRSICLIFYPIYVNVRFLVRIFCPIFCLNYLNVRFFRPIFFVRVLSDSKVRITQLQCPASLSLKSMAKLNWLNRNLFIPCLACANFVMVILLLATFWCSVTMFTKLQFLISNFGTAGVLSLSITVASHQRRILSIKQDIMVFHCMKTKIL